MPQSNVFISYAHEDKEWLERLLKHLSVLKREGRLKPWSDENLSAGDLWETKIDQALEGAALAVLLVSADFLDSEFIMEKELPVLMRRFKEGTLWKILPLIVRPCNWKEMPEIKKMDARPKDSHRESVLEGSAAEQEKDFKEFAFEILNALKQKPPSPSPPVPPGPVLDYVPVPSEADPVVLEINLSSRGWNRYHVELTLTQSASDTQERPLRYTIPLDTRLFQSIPDAANYAQQLYRQLFPEVNCRAFVERARSAAAQQNSMLRVCLAINACARELNNLRWELLGWVEPQSIPLSSPSTCFMRFAGVDIRSWRDIRRRPKSSMEAALISVVAQGGGRPGLQDNDAMVDHLHRAAAAFKEAGIRMADLRPDIRAGDLHEFINVNKPDILYLAAISPNTSGGLPVSDQISEEWTTLLQALREVEVAPRAVVIVPWIFPGDSPTFDGSEKWVPLMRLANDVAETGVIGVLTIQAEIPLDGWHRFLVHFLQRLSADGHLDHAVHSARPALESQNRQWAPVAISGVRTGRIWYVPHFTDKDNTAINWGLITNTIHQQKCTPIIGPGLNSKVARFRAEIARNWADNYNYPMALHERVSLARVSQYIACEFGSPVLYEDFEKQYCDFIMRRFGSLLPPNQEFLSLDKLISEVAKVMFNEDPEEPHQVLAELPFSIYVTASLNSFLSDALAKANKVPQEIVLGIPKFSPAVSAISEPAPKHPLVYHLFGKMNEISSSVLTEDDYFDFLIHFWRDKESIPGMVRSKLANSSLIFLGFKMNDWDFRVLFRSLLEIEGSMLRSRYMHVAVQVDPDDDQVTDPGRACKYLENYFTRFGHNRGQIKIFWGSAEDFLHELKEEWKEFEAEKERRK